MERTGRSPQEVLDDTALGVFAEGWKEGFGADADHLKTTEDIDACVAVGYTFFTFDPGEYVDAAAEAAGASALHKAFEDLPWRELKDHPADMKKRYLDAVWGRPASTIQRASTTTPAHSPAFRPATTYGGA
jgi:hypothetical protein